MSKNKRKETSARIELTVTTYTCDLCGVEQPGFFHPWDIKEVPNDARVRVPDKFVTAPKGWHTLKWAGTGQQYTAHICEDCAEHYEGVPPVLERQHRKHNK